jgi:hypothetical protein
VGSPGGSRERVDAVATVDRKVRGLRPAKTRLKSKSLKINVRKQIKEQSLSRM